MTDPSVTREGGRFRDLVKVEGTFRHHWDVRDFPFDRHHIEILATASKDTRRFRFVADGANSGYNKEIAPEGWRITDFHLYAADHHYRTNYGDITLTPGAGSAYSRLHVRIGLERSDPTVFWKLTAPLYLTVLIAAFMFMLSSDHEELGLGERLDGFQNRLGVLGGGLFVVVVNMQQAETTVSSTTGLTLIDWLHLLTLVFLLLAIVGTAFAWHSVVRGGDKDRDGRRSRLGGLLGIYVYALLAGGLVWLAALG